jgi:hypothetical protein
MFAHMLAMSGGRAHANVTAYLRGGASPGIARQLARSPAGRHPSGNAGCARTIGQSVPTYASLR